MITRIMEFLSWNKFQGPSGIQGAQLDCLQHPESAYEAVKVGPSDRGHRAAPPLKEPLK
jgi:hypothetical protein